MNRKAVLAWLLAIALVIASPVALGARSVSAAQLTSASCILMDARTGEVLFQKNADTQRSMASTTKIMTLLLAIELTDPNEIVVIPSSVEDIPNDSSRVPVFYGESMPMRDLWYGLIYRSGNDAANAIAEIAAGSVSAFVGLMNERARELGLNDTHFENTHGYTQAGHYTSARDLAKLTMYALNIDAFREVTLSSKYTMQPTELREALTLYHDYALSNPQSPYYYRYARGIKTGYTVRAGQCFVGAAIKGGNELIVVILNCGGLKETKWGEAKLLYEYGFEKLAERK